MKTILLAVLIAVAAFGQNPPQNVIFSQTDPTGKACTVGRNPNITYTIPSPPIDFVCGNGAIGTAGTYVAKGTGAITVVAGAVNGPASGVTINGGANGVVCASSSGASTAPCGVTGTGNVVQATSPSLVTPDLGTPSAISLINGTGLSLTTGVTGQLPNANLANPATTVNGQSCVLGATCTITAVPSGVTASQPVLASNGSGGVIAGTTTGTGSTVVLSVAPTITGGNVTTQRLNLDYVVNSNLAACTINSIAYTTAVDCAGQQALYDASLDGRSRNVFFPEGNWTGLTNLAAPNTASYCINLVGAGQSVSTYTLGASNATGVYYRTHNSGTPTISYNCYIRDITINANGNAPTVLKTQDMSGFKLHRAVIYGSTNSSAAGLDALFYIGGSSGSVDSLYSIVDSQFGLRSVTNTSNYAIHCSVGCTDGWIVDSFSINTGSIAALSLFGGSMHLKNWHPFGSPLPMAVQDGGGTDSMQLVCDGTTGPCVEFAGVGSTYAVNNFVYGTGTYSSSTVGFKYDSSNSSNSILGAGCAVGAGVTLPAWTLTSGSSPQNGTIFGASTCSTTSDWTNSFKSMSLNGTVLSAAPRMTWYGFSSTSFASANTGFAGEWLPTSAIYLTRLDVRISTAPVGCSTYPVLAIRDGTAATNLATITLAAGTYDYQNTLANISVPAGHELIWSIPTAAVGCSTPPSTFGGTVEYIMQ